MFESKRRALIFISLSFILATIAGLLFFTNVQDLNSELGGMTEVYVAKDNIASRETIRPEQVERLELPNRYVTDAHITSLEQLEGNVSVIPLTEGDMITMNMLRPFTEVSDAGNRLVNLMKELGNVYFDQDLQALDRVDIIVSHNFDNNPITEIFMTDVPVASVRNGPEGIEGIAVEISFMEAPNLIHMQNFGQSIRVLKSNSGSEGIFQPIDDTNEAVEEVEEEIEEEVEDESTDDQ